MADPRWEDSTPLEADIVVQVPEPEQTQADVPTWEQSEEIGPVTWADELQYGVAAGETFTGNLSILLESLAPLGRLDVNVVEPTEENPFQIFDVNYISPEEAYGPEWANMDTKDRVAFLKQQRDAQIAEEYRDVIDSGAAESGLATTGKIVGSLLDPTTVIPIGQSYKTMALTAGVIGAEYDALSQVVNKQSIDPVQTAAVAGLSAVGAPALAYTLSAAGKSVGQVMKANKAKKQAKALQEADNAVDEINTVIAEGTAKGVQIKDMPKYIQDNLGLGEDELATIVGQSTKKFHIPSPAEAQKIVELKAYQADPVGSRIKFPRIDEWLGVMRTNLNKVSPKLANRLLEFETRSHVMAAKGLEIMAPFSKGFQALPKAVQRQASLHMFNGDFDAARSLFAQYSQDLIPAFDNVAGYLNNTFDNLVGVGYNVNKIPNYFPRVVKDLKALQAKLTNKQLADVEKVWAQRAKQLGKPQLSNKEKELILSEMIQGRKISFPDDKTIVISPGARPSTAPTATKQRMIGQLDDKLLDEYEDPITALHHYVKQTAHDIEKRKFFSIGRSNKDAVDLDVENSINALLREEIDAGRLKADDIEEAMSLLKARFGEGEKSAAGLLQDIRNTGYITTIGDPIATLTQIGDIGLAAYYNGLGPTLKALLGRKKLDVRQLGVEDIIAQEFLTSNRLSSRLLNTALGLSGFRFVDRLGKNTLINGSLIKAQKMAGTDKGVAALRKKYGQVFGDEFDLLINDLKAGTISDRVKMYTLGELANVQPVFLSEMPVKYLQMPNGRVIYQLKSYMIKQLDLIRNDMVRQAKTNPKEALANAMAYLAIVPSTGAAINEVKDLALGRGFNADEIPDNYIENMLKYLMASEYTLNTVSDTGKIGEVAKDTLLGGWGVLADNLNAVGQDLNALSKGELTADDSKILARSPIFGRLWYNYIGGGLEKFEAKEFQGQFALPDEEVFKVPGLK